MQAAGPAQLRRACLAGAGPVDDVSQGAKGAILCTRRGADRGGVAARSVARHVATRKGRRHGRLGEGFAVLHGVSYL